MREASHWVRLWTNHFSIYSSVRHRYGEMLWFIAKNLRLKPEPINVSSYNFRNSISSEITKDVQSLSQMQLTQMQTIITAFCQGQDTINDARNAETVNTLKTFHKWLTITRKWIIHILRKYPQQIAKVLFMLLKPDMTAEQFLSDNSDDKMMVEFSDGFQKYTELIPARDTPNVIYNHIICFAGLSEVHTLQQFGYQHPKQLQIAILCFIELSTFVCRILTI